MYYYYAFTVFILDLTNQYMYTVCHAMYTMKNTIIDN